MRNPLLVSIGLIGTVLAVGAAMAVATEDGRGPALASLGGVSSDGRTLHFSVNSCHGDPEGTVVRESATEVVVSVVSDIQTGDHDGCADGISVRLRQPLGERELIDAATGEVAPRGPSCCAVPGGG